MRSTWPAGDWILSGDERSAANLFAGDAWRTSAGGEAGGCSRRQRQDFWHPGIGHVAEPSQKTKKASKHKCLLAQQLQNEAEGSRTLNLRIDSPMNEIGNRTGGGCKPIPEQALTEPLRTAPVGNPKTVDKLLCGRAGIDRDLQTIIDRWPGLSPELRAAVLRMIG